MAKMGKSQLLTRGCFFFFCFFFFFLTFNFFLFSTKTLTCSCRFLVIFELSSKKNIFPTFKNSGKRFFRQTGFFHKFEIFTKLPLTTVMIFGKLFLICKP